MIKESKNSQTLSEVVETITKALVDEPDSVKVRELQSGISSLTELSVTKRDAGIDTYHYDKLYSRIAQSVEKLLAEGNVVAPVDVLVNMGLLDPTRFDPPVSRHEAHSDEAGLDNEGTIT